MGRIRHADRTAGAVIGDRTLVHRRVTRTNAAHHQFFRNLLGSTQITVYAFDVFRGDPRIEQTITGAALLPRGNLLGVGGEVTIPVGVTSSLVPRFEFRHSAAAPDEVNRSLQKLGQSLRVGADWRARARQNVAVVVHVDGLTGSVQQSGAGIGLTGFRAALHIELMR